MLDLLRHNKILYPSKLKTYANYKVNMAQNKETVSDRLENIVETGEKCCLPAVSPFPIIFSRS